MFKNNIRFSKGSKSGSIVIYTLFLLTFIMFLVSCINILQSNSFKYFNEEYKELLKEGDINDSKEKLFTSFYNYLDDNKGKYKDSNELLKKIDGYENKLEVDNNNVGYTKNVRLVFKNNIVYIDYAYKLHAYKHEKYIIENENNKFLLKKVYNNTSNEENNYEEIQ